MRLIEIQNEMHRLLDEADREIEAIRQSMADSHKLTAPSTNAPPEQIEPDRKAASLQRRLESIASS